MVLFPGIGRSTNFNSREENLKFKCCGKSLGVGTEGNLSYLGDVDS